MESRYQGSAIRSGPCSCNRAATAPAHLISSFIREGDGQQRARCKPSLKNQMRQAADNDPRLSATRAGQDQQWPFGVENGFSLTVVESFEEVHEEELIVA